MTADEKRGKVAEAYATLIGRNLYSQQRRDYCFRPYEDGEYYSDASSSICYSYKEAGVGFGVMNEAGMYNSHRLGEVGVKIERGQITNPEVLRVGDILLFAGADKGREYAGFVGHCEMVFSIENGSIHICGHSGGRPCVKKLGTYCRSRYVAKTSTKIGNKGLIKVMRYIEDDADNFENMLEE